MTDKTSLGDRMKRYEQSVSGLLIPRTPTIIRVDGKAFHTFTRKLTSKVDPSCATGPSADMHKIMMAVANALCSQIQNCVFAYSQSDEISFFLRDWDELGTQQWFGGKVQKIVSISAAMASVYFEVLWRNHWIHAHPTMVPTELPQQPLFDARVFQLPKEEVTNYFIWRQKDATRNSINFVARLYFSHKQLDGKNTSEVQDMLYNEHNVNWNDLATWKKRGACVVDGVLDDEIPIFTQDRSYIDRHLEKELEHDDEYKSQVS